MLKIYKTPVLPILEYSNFLNPLSLKHMIKKKQRIQNHAPRIIFNHQIHLSREELHIKANLSSLSQQADKQLLCMIYKISHKLNEYPTVSDSGNARSSQKIKFILPKPNCERFKDFPIYGTMVASYGTIFLLHTRGQHPICLLKNQIARTPNFTQYSV